MLKQRIITALVLLPIVLGAIFWLPNVGFALAMAIPLLIGADEWANMMGITDQPQRIPFIALVATLLAVVFLLDQRWILVVAFAWWLLSFYLVKSFPDKTSLWESKPRMVVMGLLILVPAWLGLVVLQGQKHGSWMVLYSMLLVWGADTGAYFAGKRWGTTKMAPRVSPGKSIAGLIGGLVTTAIIALLVAIYTPAADSVGLVVFLLISMLAVFASVEGDLVESMVKRHRGIKDSGNLLPGHGGILDRIDSVTAAVPVFVGGLYLAGGLA